jgi:Zn-dependent metalloprotease
MRLHAALFVFLLPALSCTGSTDDMVLEQRTPHRYQQFHRGVPVFDGTLLAHGPAVFDRTRKGLSVDTAAGISADFATELAQIELGGGERKVEPVLGIHTRYGLRLRDTGLAPGPEDDGRNAADFERSALEDRLAWRMMMVFPDGDASEVFVDAADGRILEVRPAVHYAVGHSQYSGDVTVKTTNTGSGARPYRLKDTTRGDSQVFFVDTSTPAADADNEWGDGTPLTGTYTSSSSTGLYSADSQTPAVDAAYGYAVTYDMYKNVFSLDMSLWDRDGPRTDLIVHGPGGNAFYSSASDDLSFADGTNGTPFVPIDTVGHEFTHRVDSHTNVSGSLPYTMKEGFADMFACLAKIYRNGGATGSSLPDISTLDDWRQFGEYKPANQGRYLNQPDLVNAPSYWYSGIGGIDEHDAGGVIARAFYFTSEGASAHVDAHTDPSFGSYSDLLPWGLTYRSKPDGAGRIFYLTMTECLENDDYNEARECAMFYAGLRDIILGTNDLAQVKNAFGGIGVGALDSAYPAAPPTQTESEYNGTWATADPITLTSAPAGYEAIAKARVSGLISTSTDEDVFAVDVPCSATFGALVTRPSTFEGKLVNGDFKVTLHSSSGLFLAASDSDGELTYEPPSSPITCTFGTTRTYYLKVKNPSVVLSSTYLLRIDSY